RRGRTAGRIAQEGAGDADAEAAAVVRVHGGLGQTVAAPGGVRICSVGPASPALLELSFRRVRLRDGGRLAARVADEDRAERAPERPQRAGGPRPGTRFYP